MSDSLDRDVRERLDQDFADLEAGRNELDAYARLVCARLSRGTDFRLRFVEARVKGPISVVRKIREKGSSLEHMYEAVGDMIGARVVVYNLSDVNTLRDESQSDDACPVEDVSVEEIDSPAGYRVLYLNGRLGRFGSEIQIRTVVQDAWAVSSRADVYRESADQLNDQLFMAQASVLRGVDEVLQVVRDRGEQTRDRGAIEAESAKSLERCHRAHLSQA